MAEIGLFPLDLVLVPTEQVPLHIFEPRYRELIGECIDEEREFGLLYADEEGVRELGTRARVAEVLERFDRANEALLVGRQADRRLVLAIERRLEDAAEVDDVVDEPGDVDEETRTAAAGAFRALAALAGAETEVDEEQPELSFALAAQVELPPEDKQQLLESRSEQERLELVAELLDAARKTLIATRELSEKAKRNGHR